MRLGPAGGRWLASLLGAALAMSALRAVEPSELVPGGFVREDLKEIHAFILRPEKWFCRCTIPGSPFYNLSPQPFEGPLGLKKGVALHVMVRTDEPADVRAAKMIASLTTENKVLRGWTRRDTPEEPFTVYGLVCVLQGEETGGEKLTCEVVFVANRVTNTVYQCWLVAPSDEWKEVEHSGELMLASLQPDPKF